MSVFLAPKFDEGFRKDAVNNVFDKQNLQGASWRNTGGSRSGMGSMLDSGKISEHQRVERQNYGAGFVSFKVDKQGVGADAKYPPMKLGGRIHYPDDEGRLVIVDGDFLKHELEIDNQRRAYIADVIEKASINDAICSMVLGTNANELLGPDKNGGGCIVDRDLIKVSALPSAIETYDTHGITYSQAIQKFKIVVSKICPIIDDMTSDKDLKPSD